MLLDDQIRFTVAAGMTLTTTAASTYTVDLGAARDMGAGERLFLVVTNNGAMTGAGVTVTPSLRCSATRDTATPPALSGSPTTLATLPAFDALSADGTQRIIPLPPGSADHPWLRYIDVYFTVAGGSNAGAKFLAFITHDIDANTCYPAGYQVQ